MSLYTAAEYVALDIIKKLNITQPLTNVESIAICHKELIDPDDLELFDDIVLSLVYLTRNYED